MKKFIILLTGVLLFPLIFTKTSYAQNEESTHYVKNQLINEATIEATIKSRNSHEQVKAVIEELHTQNNSFSGTSYTSKAYKVSFYFPKHDGSFITPQTDQGGSKTEVGATATINVVYNKKGELIDLQRVYGGWKPENSLYYITDREVIYRADSITAGKTAKKNPTSNSFSYNPGWGYIQYFPSSAYSGTGADSWATIRVSGMAATYEIQLSVRV
ncbi:hypothetical protein HGI30_21855 [Paenibacillus albicereus]|uniref:Uncharacterized protein n=1 Tax=Paenibacillus albicereus TaxID=2726185 RepID=A0A6H2H2M3_9BACL|nr:hypothetical protein [Paenibacillus albicereus]QJC53907.1 hypothetical protein HGI30_21855 [Paenibacillus albicereus]